MRHIIPLIVITTIILSGCATVGPEPTNKDYSQAITSMPIAKEALYSVPASWYPNTLLGDAMSFHATSTSGRLFITPKRLLFAVYDDSTNSFLQSYEVTFSKISWMTGKYHGVARIIRFSANNTIQSFLFGSWTKGEDAKLNKDQLLEYILGRVQPKKQTVDNQ